MTRVLFEYYKLGLERLVAAVGDDHPKIPTLHILQQRLFENLVTPASVDISMTNRAITHADILDGLNHLCLELTGKPFSTFCEVPQETPPTLAKHEEAISFADYLHWLTPLLSTEKLQLPAVRAMIQARTLAFLEHITDKEKGLLVQHLHSAGVISTAEPILTLAHGNLRRMQLVEAELDGVNLAEADIRGAHLVGALLRESQFTRAVLVGANLAWTVMARSHLTEAELGGATLTGVDLREADVRGAHLIMANLKRADLSQANLSGTNLLRANLEEAILTAANLSGAILLWTNFTHTRLDGTKLDKATYNHYTLWPEDFDPAAAGAIRIA